MNRDNLVVLSDLSRLDYCLKDRNTEVTAMIVYTNNKLQRLTAAQFCITPAYLYANDIAA